ncbi:MAG TPA: ATP-grasp domain-containing protein [Micromonosporaceae bacterium]
MMSATGNQAIGVVVDGYSAGNFFPAAFAKLDTRLVHVQGTPDLIPSMRPPDLSEYLDNIIYTDEATVVERLRGYSPVCVVAGQESAVPMTDRLSECLGLASNGSKLSPARRNKYEMIETLRRAGVRCAQQFKSGDPGALVAWAERGGVYPVVVKPLSSAATDGVYICGSAEDVATAAELVLSSRDIFGHPNREALIQSYLDGVEYIIDTVSCDGHHHVSGIWRYEKLLLPSGKNIYDRDILVDPGDPPAPALISYIEQVLTALNIRWGAAHSEVINTADGPALVELGARANGNIDPGFHDACIGSNQVDQTVLAYVRPAEFKQKFGDRVYTKLQHGVVYNAPTEFDGIVESIDEVTVEEIRRLKSVHLVNVKLAPGGRIRPTVDLLTAPLRVFLTGQSFEQVTSDYEEVRRLKDRVYRVRQS